jgi:predicted tellurium resistance membrane protein TerC
LYLALHHFLKKGKKDPLVPSPSVSFWRTVIAIELFDLAFAIDSIVAGVAFIGTSSQNAIFNPKLWIVYVGGLIGVFAIRYAAHFFSFLILRYPRLETAAYCMIGWIGLKLGLQSFSFTFPYYELVFWAVLALIFLFGLTRERSHV